jgi:YHS domain-containing protein
VTDPEFALFHLQRALWDPVEPNRLGSLSAALHARVNGEYYRFAGRRTMRVFAAAPSRYCGLLRDPVTGLRFYPTARSPRCEWDGGPYFFTGDSTRREFRRAPKKYEVKRSF